MSKAEPRNITTLLMDLDGTLINQKDTVLTSIKFLWSLFPRLRQNQSRYQTWKNIKQGGEALQKGDKLLTNHARMVKVFQQNLALKKEDAENLVMDSFKHAYPTLKNYFTPKVGAAKFVDWAKDHYTLILATNPIWPLELVKERMLWGNINPEHFKRITTADQMNYCKPDPSFYQQILEQENLNAKNCLMIGNEEKMDLPATQAGIPVFLIDQKLKKPITLQAPSLDPYRPGAWKGSYDHLKMLLSDPQSFQLTD